MNAYIRALAGGILAALASAIPLATRGTPSLADWLSVALVGVVGTGLTAAPSGFSLGTVGIANPGELPADLSSLASEVEAVAPEAEKVVEAVAPVLEQAVPQAAPVVAAVEGALNPGATPLP